MRFGLLLSLFLIGCANAEHKCGDKALLLWPGETGTYKFKEVSLGTLSDPYKLSGPAARVYYEAGFDQNGFVGDVAQPSLTNSNGVCVPTDAGSSIALTAYAIMDRLLAFDTRLGVAAQLSWPRKVGVEFHMRGDPIDTANNAHYFGDQDAIGVVPFSRPGLPVALNHGIVAHEHFHAHFQSQVIAKLNHMVPQNQSVDHVHAASTKVTTDDLGQDIRSPLGLNNYILRGWNEGLADFYGSVFTDRPDFFVESMSSSEHRRVDLEPRRLATAADFQFLANTVFQKTGESDRLLTSYAYQQGTQIGRLMYHLAFATELSAEQFLTLVMNRLSKIPEAIGPDYARVIMEPDAIVSILLSDLRMTAKACARLRDTVQKNTLRKGFPQCSGL
ncbi:MAG: hypothetical protein KF799_13045 [Bdellovibrionales bacterium]|nr:hypothetical protein [Bdellovibrionales bacterium]